MFVIDGRAIEHGNEKRWPYDKQPKLRDLLNNKNTHPQSFSDYLLDSPTGV
jgi:hypothetical protein